MRYSQLRAFHAVATYGGFSAAAETLSQTQPALSEQVRKLEQAHDTLLFDRQKRQVRLTAKGDALFRLTKRYFEVEEAIELHLSASQARLQGRLRIIADAAQHLMPALTHFRQQYPSVKIQLQTGNTDRVLGRLRAYDAEIGVVGRLDPGSDLTSVGLGTTPIVAVVARNGHFRDVERLAFGDLSAHPIVMREEGSRTRAALLAEAARRRQPLRPMIDVEGREAMREVVAAGAGIGFVSLAELGHDVRLRQIVLSDADLTMPEMAVFVTMRRDVPVIRAFRRSIEMTLPG